MSATLVIARYAEILDWLSLVPTDLRIIVYSKGEAIIGSEVFGLGACIEKRRNIGREAETYLHHLAALKENAEQGGFTIFCQGHPFDHSPDFLDLMNDRGAWQDIQPLTSGWLDSHQVPPAELLASETGEHINRLRVRSELYSLYTWNALRYVDDGAVRIGRDYLSGHGLPAGTNIAAHFLRSAGWNELAEQAEAADFGQFAYGGIFAVRNELIQRIPEDVLRRLHLMSRSHPLYPWIFERLWLHLFGLPFHPAIRRHSGNVLGGRGAVASSPTAEALCP